MDIILPLWYLLECIHGVERQICNWQYGIFCPILAAAGCSIFYFLSMRSLREILQGESQHCDAAHSYEGWRLEQFLFLGRAKIGFLLVASRVSLDEFTQNARWNFSQTLRTPTCGQWQRIHNEHFLKTGTSLQRLNTYFHVIPTNLNVVTGISFTSCRVSAAIRILRTKWNDLT